VWPLILDRLKKVLWSLRVRVHNDTRPLRLRLLQWRLGKLPVVADPGGGAAVIVAPHPDDDIFGAGGLIAMKRDGGFPVRVIFLTNGEAAHDSCCGMRHELVGQARRDLAVDACKALGVEAEELRWCSLPDGGIPRRNEAGYAEAVEQLAWLLKESGASEVYCPHVADGWRDHVSANRLVVVAVRHSGLSLRIFGYLVWALYDPPLTEILKLRARKGRRLDIDRVKSRKSAAMGLYLDASPAPCGFPYCGRLPQSLIDAVREPYEVFLPVPDA